MKKRDQILLEQAYEEVAGGQKNNESVPPQQFMADILSIFNNSRTSAFYHVVYFGEEKQGDKAGTMFALVEEIEDVQEEDKRYSDSSYTKYYNKLKEPKPIYGIPYETSEWLPENVFNPLAISLLLNYPNLNKHIDISQAGFLKGDVNAARQIADKLTGWNHSEMMGNYAYEKGFEDEKNGQTNNRWNKDTLNYHFYDFGVYEAHTN